MKNDKDIILPQFTASMDETAITLIMMRWLNNRGCAVVVWTQKELRGLNPQDIEGTLIECGSEAIFALTGEMNTSGEDSTDGEAQ